MCSVRFTLTAYSRNAVERHLKTAQQQGCLRQVKYGLASLAVGDGQSIAEVALVLRGHEKTVTAWVRQCCGAGLQGAPDQKPTGRPPKLSPTQKAELAPLLDAGPLKAGFCSACWRSPMIQQRIDDRLGIFSNVFSIAQLLTTLGLSDQQAAFVAAHLDAGQRQAWGTTTWPQMVRLAQARQALLLCGDEASLPQWGTLSYTWARRGHQPLGKTAGTRQGDKVFGVIESVTGRFWSQGQEGRLTSAASITVLTHVLEQTTHPIILIQAGAKYPTSAAMPHCFTRHTERITVCQWPSDAPDDHPIEKLWKKVKKAGTH